MPELDTEIQARKGFNVIATANDRDRGINELSSALKRRFNTVILPLPATLEIEVDIVARRVAQLGRALEFPAEAPALEEVRRVVTIFRELRGGQTIDGKAKVKMPSAVLSTAEAIAVVNQGLSLAAHFGNGRLGAARPRLEPGRDRRARSRRRPRRLGRIPRDGRQGAQGLVRPVRRLSQALLSRRWRTSSCSVSVITGLAPRGA